MKSSDRKIEHVFVIMLENRSFDNLLGMSGIEGILPISGNYNNYGDKKYLVSSPAPGAMTTDPGHEVPDVLQQLTNLVQEGSKYAPGQKTWKPPIRAYPRDKFPTDFANGTGFARNYVENTDEDNPGLPASDHIGDVMKCMSPEQLPVLNALAREFAVCTQWYSSLPGPTWPNRFFLHLAASSGLDCTPTQSQILGWLRSSVGFPAPKGTIFQALKNNFLPYKLYHDYIVKNHNNSAFSDDPENGGGIEGLGWIPQYCSLPGVQYYKDVAELKSNFVNDLANDYPYNYTFIEPHYGNLYAETYRGGSSQHPMDDVFGGEALVKFVYESLRNNPQIWEKSLLIITYDEHGGFYDSVPPPSAVPPNDGSPKYGEPNTLNTLGFEFDQYGVRVPAIIVSPFIPKNTVDKTVYDHTSVLATLERLFDVEPLTDRDMQANDLIHLLSLETARKDCPTKLPEPVSLPEPLTPPKKKEIAQLDLQPLPESGNLIGAMAILAKMDHEISMDSPTAELQVRTRAQQIKTRGDLKAYAREVAQKIAEKKATQ